MRAAACLRARSAMCHMEVVCRGGKYSGVVMETGIVLIRTEIWVSAERARACAPPPIPPPLLRTPVCMCLCVTWAGTRTHTFPDGSQSAERRSLHRPSCAGSGDAGQPVR